MRLEPWGANPNFQKTEILKIKYLDRFFVFAFLDYFIFCHFSEERDIILYAVSPRGSLLFQYIFFTHTHVCMYMYIYYIGYIYGKCIYYLVYIFLGYILIMLKFS